MKLNNVRDRLAVNLYEGRPLVMGIINVTPDSFYSESRIGTEGMLRDRIREIISQGGDIIDIGGCSTRPGSGAVSVEEEWKRIAPAIGMARSIAPDMPLSVDTFRSEIAERCCHEYDVEIINDISGGDMDPKIFRTVAATGAVYVMMHTKGTPEDMQSKTDYKNVVAEVISALAFKVDRLHQLGVADVIVDPGFGFAKTIQQNFRMLANLEEFVRIGLPVLVGLSRKSMIYKLLGATPENSLAGTVALNMVALQKGARILRVHDVREACQTVELHEMLRANA